MATTKVTYISFLTNYEVKNGYVGDAATLNKAVDQVKGELDSIYGWLKGGQVADDGSALSGLIGFDENGSYMSTKTGADVSHDVNGYISFVDGTLPTNVVRSVDMLHKEVFDGGFWS